MENKQNTHLKIQCYPMCNGIHLTNNTHSLARSHMFPPTFLVKGNNSSMSIDLITKRHDWFSFWFVRMTMKLGHKFGSKWNIDNISTVWCENKSHISTKRSLFSIFMHSILTRDFVPAAHSSEFLKIIFDEFIEMILSVSLCLYFRSSPPVA